MTLNEREAFVATCALRSAAALYEQHAETAREVHQGRLAVLFDEQAHEARLLAAKLEA